MWVHQQYKKITDEKVYIPRTKYSSMIITLNQMKAMKLFWEKYLEEDWSKSIFTDKVAFVRVKLRSRKWTP